MIQCETCKEWYHGSCVNITPTDALDIDEYKCLSVSNEKDACSDYLVCSYLVSHLKVTQEVK